ncbi:hypothetical protein [Streptomyces sp. C]|uniref:hypothetical protein n=1 Tax=Streptomyces sp. C TaxID=253839 RepID=UPI0001B4F276|nr:hypothetical protein [Streptomyces sp. C]EFL19882.1 predicted protein [Streptomyces sp. C]
MTAHESGQPLAHLPWKGSLTELLKQLEGEHDHWNRPDGNWGEGVPINRAERDRREHANSMYVLGSKALLREEFDIAADWLGQATDESHPGAWFRYAVLVHRLGPEFFGEDEARVQFGFLVAGAAECGPGDATRMRPLLRDPRASLAAVDEWEDPRFAPELLAALRARPCSDPEGPPGPG